MSKVYRFAFPIDRAASPDAKVRTGEVVFIERQNPHVVDRVVEVLIDLNIEYYDARAVGNWQYMNTRQIREYIQHRAPRSGREYEEMRREQMRFCSTPGAGSPDIYEQLAADFSVRQFIKPIKQDNTMSNENKYDPKTGALLPTPYASRIKGGNELEVGKRYKLEVVGGKNPPAVAKAGDNFTAIGDSEGGYSGDVIDTITFRVFSTDANDLWIAA